MGSSTTNYVTRITTTSPVHATCRGNTVTKFEVRWAVPLMTVPCPVWLMCGVVDVRFYKNVVQLIRRTQTGIKRTDIRNRIVLSISFYCQRTSYYTKIHWFQVPVILSNCLRDSITRWDNMVLYAKLWFYILGTQLSNDTDTALQASAA